MERTKPGLAEEDACCPDIEGKSENPDRRPMIRLHDSPFVRGLCLSLGIVVLILAGLGVVLPLLPTTPFVLLAAACFARSSKTFHDRLLAHRIVGPIISEWHEHRSMSRQVKRWAYLLMILSFGVSILLMDSTWHRVMLAVLGTVLGLFLWRVPVHGPDRAGRA